MQPRSESSLKILLPLSKQIPPKSRLEPRNPPNPLFSPRANQILPTAEIRDI